MRLKGGWTRALRPSAARRPRGLLIADDGFTVVEITIATGVVLTALVLLASVLTTGLTSTAVAREREAATGLANQTLELIRALPYDTLLRGLDATDLANTAGTVDPNVTTSGCGAGTYCYAGERIVHGNNPTPVDPLVPHIKTSTTTDNLAKPFSIASYVTYKDNNLTTNAYRVTVHITWTSNVRSGKEGSIKAQTIVFPNGCLSLPEHTYSGPCQASYTGSATVAPSTVTVSGQGSDPAVIGGIDLAKAVLYSGAATSDVTVEQTARVDGLTQGAGAVLQATGLDATEVGRASASSQADNDPDPTKGPYETADMPASTPTSHALPSGTGTLTANVGGGDTGRTTSTTSAKLSSNPGPHPCPNFSSGTPANETDSLPCGGSTSTTTGTTTLSSSLNVGPLNVASFLLASIGPQSGPTTAITDRATSASVDTVRATMSRSQLDFAVGGLPTVLRPAGFTDYFVKVTDYQDSVDAQAGVGSTAPSSGSTGGTLSFYNGASYTDVPLSTIDPSTIPSIPAVSYSVPGVADVTLTATITPGSKTTTSSCSGTCTRTSASAKVTPLTVAVDVTITAGGMTALDVTLALDPGTLHAKTSYVAAPTS